MQEFRRAFKEPWFLAGCALLIAILVAATIVLRPVPVVEARVQQCVPLLLSGEIYGGQPYCEQGPVVYYALGLHALVLPDALYGTGVALSSMALLLLTFLLLISILRSQDLLRHTHLPWLASGFIIAVVMPAWGRYEMILCSLFVALGLLAMGSKSRFGPALTGVAFAFALLSKFSVAPLVAILIAYRVLERSIISGKKGLKVSKSTLKDALTDAVVSAAAIAVILFLVKLLHPDYLLYSLIVHLQATTKVGIGTAIGILTGITAQPDWSHLIIYVLVAYLLYRWYRRPHLSLFVASVGLLGALSLYVRGSANLGGLNTTIPKATYYFAPYYLLVLLAFAVLWARREKDEERWGSALLVGVTILVFLAPGYFMDPLNEAAIQRLERDQQEKRDQVIDTMREVFDRLPPQERILMDGPDVFKERYAFVRDNLAAGKLDFIDQEMQRSGAQIDPAYGPVLIRLLGDKYTRWSQTAFDGDDELSRFVERYKAREYSLIIISPPVLLSVQRVIETDPAAVSDYCGVLVPEASYFGPNGLHTATLIFRDKEDCSAAVAAMGQHYAENVARICAISPFFADLSVGVLQQQGIVLNGYRCSAPRDYALDDGAGARARLMDAEMLIVILGTVGLVAFAMMKRDG